MSDREKEILDSWRDNAAPWIKAVRNGEIKSRETVTNAAIIAAVLNAAPKRVLDVGCGEGWLCRALNQRGIDTLGIDAQPALIEAARAAGGKFMLMRYQQLLQWRPDTPFDALVCNFSLIGVDSVDAVFAAAAHLLSPTGKLIIQTLHPDNAQANASAWRDGSWDGFSAEFCNPAPWFCRTLPDWLALFSDAGFSQPQTLTPTLPSGSSPASLILVGQRR